MSALERWEKMIRSTSSFSVGLESGSGADTSGAVWDAASREMDRRFSFCRMVSML